MDIEEAAPAPVAAPPVAAPVGGPPGSAGRGIAAGLCAAILAVPFVAIASVVCVLLERVLLSKVLGRHVEWEEMHEGGTAAMASAVVAGASGLFGGGAAGYAALKMLGNAARRPFYLVAGAGFTVLAAAAWIFLKHKYPSGVEGNSFRVAFAWLAGLFAMVVAVEMQAEDANEAASARAES